MPRFMIPPCPYTNVFVLSIMPPILSTLDAFQTLCRLAFLFTFPHPHPLLVHTFPPVYCRVLGLLAHSLLLSLRSVLAPPF
jgi:hypothetical protein